MGLFVNADPALIAAAGEGPVVRVYILDDETPKHRAMGGASRWWLHHSLAALSRDLKALGAPLLVLRGAALDLLPKEPGAHFRLTLRRAA